VSETEEFTNNLGMRLVKIKPGKFTMGFEGSPLPEEITKDVISTDFLRYTDITNRINGDFDEHPSHDVEITRPFFMGAYQVTNAQYEEFDPGHRRYRGRRIHGQKDRYPGEMEEGLDHLPSYPEGDEEAVTYVSWEDSVSFCKWLSEREGRSYRLPTEAEWEYSCRAGTSTPYHTGVRPPDSCLEKMTSEGDPISLAVGESEPNPWGLFDMHGNVEEWCQDWYGPYAQGFQADPVGMVNGDFRVTRGGSHSSELYYLRSANRMGTIPGDRHWLIGLRVVCAPPPATEPLPLPPRELWQRDVRQERPPDLGEGPDPDLPYFDGPRPYVKIPEGSMGPLFSRHNHDPALVKCPNGDLLAIWYSCVREPGRELGLVASRLRWGRREWDPAAPFWDAPDRNDHAPAMGSDGDMIYQFCGLSIGAGYRSNLALVMRTSEDNGVTWSRARFVNPERGIPSQPVPSFIRTREGLIMFPSDAPRSSIIWISEDGGKTWRASEGRISGIHAGLVQLKDGRLMAMGRCGGENERMPVSISSDLGRTWDYSPSPFPPIRSGQRIVLMRLREGPILLCSFAGARRNPEPMPMRDASGRERPVTGLFAAVSMDEGRTWPHLRLVSDDGPGREIEAMDGNKFTMGFESAEPLGYLAACQADNGVIHLITSRQHYSFNLSWLKTPAPPSPVGL